MKAVRLQLVLGMTLKLELGTALRMTLKVARLQLSLCLGLALKGTRLRLHLGLGMALNPARLWLDLGTILKAPRLGVGTDLGGTLDLRMALTANLQLGIGLSPVTMNLWLRLIAASLHQGL